MNWLDKFKDKIGPAVPAAAGENKQRPGPNREAGGTVVRAGATPAQTIAKPGVRFQPNHEVTIDLQIKSLLGSGGMGEVYLARQRTWGVDVALKIPNDEIISDPENRHRIVREAEAWTDLGLHPHIAYCYYAQPLGELLLLVIEYVDGGNLRDWIANGRCADLKTGLDLAIQFCHGLEHAHKKDLVHRDIKPENILLMQDGTLKITDFGIVHKALTNLETLESTGAVRRVAAGMTSAGIGTPDYMAPEQWEDQGEIDFRADIFAFGICLYEMLCGARPYPMTAGPRQEAPEPEKMRGGKGLPERLCRLMKRCVDWDRAKRMTGVQEVRAELCAVYEEVFGEPCLRAELPKLTSQADDWNNRALSYLALGREEDAEKAWQTALEADPRHLESSYNYGLHRWRGAKVTDQKVLVDLREIAKSDPTAWLPRYLLAQVHLERGDGEGATDELAKIDGVGTGRAEVIAAKQAAEDLPGRHLVRTFEAIDHDGHATDEHGTTNCYRGCRSSGGRYVLAGRVFDTTMKLWDAESGLLLRTFARNSLGHVCLSADGRVALSGSRGDSLELWEVESGRRLNTWEGAIWRPGFSYTTSRPFCLSADGQYALSISGKNTLKLWGAASGHCLQTFEADTGWGLLYLSEDGRHVVGGGDDNSFNLWDWASDSCKTFHGHAGGVIDVFLSADARFVLSASNDGFAKMWDVGSAQCLRTIEGHGSYLSANGRYVLSNQLELRELASGRCLRTFESAKRGRVTLCRGTKGEDILLIATGGRDRFVSLTPDGQFLSALTLGASCTLERWRVGSFEYRAEFRLGQVVPSAEAISLALEREAVLASAERAFAIGDARAAYRCLRVARQNPRHRRAEPVVREWARLYSQLRRRALADCWVLRRREHDSNDSPSADRRYVWRQASNCCISADGRLRVAVGNEETLELWDAAGYVRTFEDEEFPDVLAPVCISADGRIVLSVSHSTVVSTESDYDLKHKLWDAASGRLLRTFEWAQSPEPCLSADGRYVLAGTRSNSWTFELWDVSRGRSLRMFEGHTDSVSSLFFSADGRFALSCGEDGTLRVWSLKSGQCLQAFELDTTICDISVDGRFALSCDRETLKLWEIESGRCLRTLEQEGGVGPGFFSADGRYVIASSGEDVVEWFLDWDLEEKEPADWDEDARPYLDVFLRAHQLYAGALPDDREPTDEEVVRALTRQGRPQWSEEDFEDLLYILGCAGYGWLRPEGVRRELQGMRAAWRDERLIEEEVAVQEGRVLRTERSSTAVDVPAPHPAADPERAARLNIEYIRARKAWEQLPWWKRIRTKQPARPTGI